ncbi:hypothetical protein Tco_0206167 [Tanacetum coccineum]
MCINAISVIDFSKDDPFSGSTTTHSDDPSPSSSPVKTSDNFVKFADELAPLDSLPPGKFSSKFQFIQVSSRISYPPLKIGEDHTQEEIDILLVPDNLIPPGVEDADSEDEVNESPNLDHQDDPSIPRPPPEPPDIEKCFEPKAGILIIKEFKGVSKSHDFMTSILPTLVSDLPFIVLFENEDTIFDPGISI